MKILYSPIASEDKITYEFGNDVITAHYKGKSDTFDFSGMPNGILDNPSENIETMLDVNPIISAHRFNGELMIELMNFIDWNAKKEERFPDWFDPDEDLNDEVESDG